MLCSVSKHSRSGSGEHCFRCCCRIFSCYVFHKPIRFFLCQKIPGPFIIAVRGLSLLAGQPRAMFLRRPCHMSRNKVAAYVLKVICCEGNTTPQYRMSWRPDCFSVEPPKAVRCFDLACAFTRAHPYERAC